MIQSCLCLNVLLVDSNWEPYGFTCESKRGAPIPSQILLYLFILYAISQPMCVYHM